VQQIYSFWFGVSDCGEACDTWSVSYKHNSTLWFHATPDIDRLMHRTFGTLVEQAIDGALTHTWRHHSPRALVSLVLLLDQFTRNIYRGTARMFAGDSITQRIVLALLDSPHAPEWQHCCNSACTGAVAGSKWQLEQHFSVIERIFLYLVLEHSEDVAVVQRALRLFDELHRSVAKPQKRLAYSMLKACQSHLAILERFARYPHRNALLGRQNTPDEEAFLIENASKIVWMRSVNSTSTATTGDDDQAQQLEQQQPQQQQPEQQQQP
jgi:uncharacterized protein (DUF924 family)